MKAFFFSVSLFLTQLSNAAWDKDLSGQLSLQHLNYLESKKSQLRQSHQIIVFKPEGKFRSPSDTWLFKFEGYARAKVTSDDENEKTFFDSPQAFVQSTKEQHRIKLGYDTFNWGVLDLNSPLDVINQRAYFDPLSPQKLGAQHLEYSWSGSSFNFQALYLPHRRKMQFPGTDSHWLPRDVIDHLPADVGRILLNDDVTYYYGDSIVYDESLKDNFAFRLSYIYDDFDFHLVHYQGVNSSPKFNLLATLNLVDVTQSPPVFEANGQIGILPIYHRQETSGLSLVWAPEFAIFRFESAYTSFETQSMRRDGLPIDNWTSQSALALEKTFYLGAGSLTTLLQYYWSDYPSKDSSSNFSNFRLFENTLVASLVWAPSDRSSFTIAALDDLSSQGTASLAYGDLKITESLRSQLRWIGLHGPNQSLIGTFRQNDSILLSLAYYF